MRIGEAWAGLNKPHTHIPSSALDSWLFTSQILNKQASPGPVKCQGNHPLRVLSSVSCQVFLALSADLLNSGLSWLLLLPHSSILGKLTTYIHTQREREALLYPAQVRVAHNLHVTHHWGQKLLCCFLWTTSAPLGVLASWNHSTTSLFGGLCSLSPSSQVPVPETSAFIHGIRKCHQL